MQQGLCDPIRVFVKDEVHKRSKLEAGMARIISSVSVVDQIVERVLWGPQNRLNIDSYQNTPSKAGFGMSLDSQCAELYSSVLEMQAAGATSESDMSHWDWTVQWWDTLLATKVRISQSKCDGESPFALISLARCFTASWSVFSLSDGSMFSQVVPGGMKSGRYATTADNSYMRAGNYALISMRDNRAVGRVVVMGDDALENTVPDAIARYSELGKVVKLYKTFTHTFNFCSHDFQVGGVAYPDTWEKLVFRYLGHQQVTHELRAELLDNLRHHPQRDLIITLIDACGGSIKDIKQ